MAESTTESDTHSPDKGIATIDQPAPSSTYSISSDTAPVIWTPRFIVLFALVLVIGLSLESILTPIILNGLIAPGAVLIMHALPILVCWIVLTIRTRSPWLRIGSIFGIIWTLFACGSFVLSTLPIDLKSALPLHLTAATDSALLGSYICLSIERTLLHRWDNWFFRLALLTSGCAVALVYFILPMDIRSARSLESVAIAVMLFLCLFVWWLRPSCWRYVPGPTLLFGIPPFILLILAIPNVTNNANLYFFSQVALLALLLGVMRMIQGEQALSHVH